MIKKAALLSIALLAIAAAALTLGLLYTNSGRLDVLTGLRHNQGNGHVEVVDLSATEKPATASADELKPASVTVYFRNDRRAPKQRDTCGVVFGVERKVTALLGATSEATEGATYALNQLFSGPTPEETGRGYNSIFSPKTASILRAAVLDGETAYINLTDIREILPAAATSCGSAQFLAEIRETLRENNGIQKVVLAINGLPKTFYDWIQVSCGAENNNCDPKPFQALD